MTISDCKYLTSIDVNNAHSNVIIVGNAYGIMPYIKPLAVELANNKIKPFWFAFSGQEKRPGYYSFSQGIKDLLEVYKHVLKDNDLPINFLTHCAGSLITIEFLKNHPEVRIDKLIVYGLLYNMNRRRPIAERKLYHSGINFKISEEDWLYNPTNSIKAINRDILFCHAKDKLNLDRATEQEMKSIQSLGANIRLKWFDEGYDVHTENISKFIGTYISYITSVQ